MRDGGRHMKTLQKFCIRSNKPVKVCIVLALLTAAAAALSLCVGAVMVNPAELFGKDHDGVAFRILRYSRLPRTCCSLLAGAALAVSGAVIQNVLSNPLAAPNIIGVNGGAGFMAALCCAFLPGNLQILPAAAFAGALVSVLMVLAISQSAGASRITLVLAGVAISSLFSAATDAVVTFVPDALAGYMDFRVGGFSGVTLQQLKAPALMIAIAMAIVFLMSRSMEILALGGETAKSLGLPVRPVRLMLLVLAAALAGAAVSFSGLLGFVGLLVPHMVRRLTQGDGLVLLAGSALGGAFLVTLCDTLARSLFSPYELPAGIVLAFIGAPFFLWLLFHQREGDAYD